MVLCSINLIAQSYNVVIHPVDSPQKKLPITPLIDNNFPSETAAYTYIQRLVPTCQAQGYLEASVDSVTITDTTFHVVFYLGKKYQWGIIKLDNLPTAIKSKYRIASSNSPEDYKLIPEKIAAITESTLQWAEQHGYPFASVWLDATSSALPFELQASFKWEPGVLQKLDSIYIESKTKISRNYLLRYLDLKQGEIYNEKKLQTISNRLNQLPFLQEDRPWMMEFKPFGNTLHLYVKEKSANTLNALVGLLPNSVETGKFLWTADANCLLQNILGTGEVIQATYQNLQYKSPRIKANVSFPYLIQSAIGVDASFDLFKKDTAFRRTTFQGGLRYQINAANFLRVFYQVQSNRLGVVDTQWVKMQKRLPEMADVKASGAGLEINYQALNHIIHPSKGWDGKVVATVLQRQVRKVDAIISLKDASGFSYASLYDSVLPTSRQMLLTASFNYYLPVFQKVVLKLAYSGGIMMGKDFFKNELYQIGGFRLLRGFDEQSIFTNHFQAIATELRLLLDAYSYFYVFSDNAFVASKYMGYNKEDIYNGFGIGTALLTKNGLFSISYGLGRHQGAPVSFKQSKIHFGYTAYF